jgi:hypothetical protein
VLCFDREAAGLMRNFPCLVVCGNDNYAYLLTSALWHSYAAGTAAAFTGELLKIMLPYNVKQIPTFSEVIRESDNQKSICRIFNMSHAVASFFQPFVRQ